MREASAGDATAAAERLELIRTMQMLTVTPASAALASMLISQLRLPTRAHSDALHVGIAATNGINYLLTWNCRHLANAIWRPRIEQVCRESGYEPPTICTPAELMESVP